VSKNRVGKEGSVLVRALAKAAMRKTKRSANENAPRTFAFHRESWVLVHALLVDRPFGAPQRVDSPALLNGRAFFLGSGSFGISSLASFSLRAV
jgi:hypothetical protein